MDLFVRCAKMKMNVFVVKTFAGGKYAKAFSILMLMQISIQNERTNGNFVLKHEQGTNIRLTNKDNR